MSQKHRLISKVGCARGIVAGGPTDRMLGQDRSTKQQASGSLWRQHVISGQRRQQSPHSEGKKAQPGGSWVEELQGGRTRRQHPLKAAETLVPRAVAGLQVRIRAFISLWLLSPCIRWEGHCCVWARRWYWQCSINRWTHPKKKNGASKHGHKSFHSTLTALTPPLDISCEAGGYHLLSLWYFFLLF